MQIGTGQRSNNYSESKEDHLDNISCQEQRNKGPSLLGYLTEGGCGDRCFNFPILSAAMVLGGFLYLRWGGSLWLELIIDLWERYGVKAITQCRQQISGTVSGKYGTSYAGGINCGGLSDCNKVYKEAGNEAVMSISVDDCIDLDGMERSILAKVKDLSVISELLKHMSSEGFDDVGLRYVGGYERCVWIDLVGLPLLHGLQRVYMDVGGRWCDSSSVYGYGKDAEGPSLDESLENKEHLDVDSCDLDSPKNVNNDSMSPSSRVLREEDVHGVENDLVNSFEEGEIRDDSVLVIGNVNTGMIMRMFTPVIALKKLLSLVLRGLLILVL
ncbi:hypothetical protein Tco_0138637 [Tanacetum coccineum]